MMSNHPIGSQCLRGESQGVRVSIAVYQFNDTIRVDSIRQLNQPSHFLMFAFGSS